MKCAGCGHGNPTGAKFCNDCGARLQTAGPGAAPGAYTPKHLAEKILTSKSALEGERKQVTVLFADLKGSMELLADRDPEEARELLDGVLERMMEAVHRYEGTVNQVMGDGIMALFGAPLAHEDHAVRACYAALRMKDTLARLGEEVERTRGVPLRIRIGLNSGEVVVRSIGSDLDMDYTAVGQTTHLAARMEQMADPGTVLVTPHTLRLAGDAVIAHSLGPRPVKGLDTPLEVHELVGAAPARSLRRTATERWSRFVGRDAELERLHGLLTEAGAGCGQIAAVTAEPGVGKSRLVYEFVNSAWTRGWTVLESSSLSYDKASAWQPVIDVLRRRLELDERDGADAVRDKVTSAMLALHDDLKGALPPILSLLDALPEDDPFWALEPRERRDAILDALTAFFLEEAGRQPLLLVFENLQWVDAETQAFLDTLLARVHTARLLLLVDYRPEYEHGWAGETGFTQLPIEALSPAAAGELLDALVGRDSSLRSLRELLVQRSNGNPFFLEEIVRTLVETNVLVGERGAYRLTTEAGSLQVPATVQAVLAARIDRLPHDEKLLLQAAAVIGTEVPFALLEAVSALSAEPLRGALHHLQAAGFLHEAGLFPDLEYRFRNTLTRDVAYASLLKEQRRALHARIVAAIERLYADRLTSYVDQLAYHASCGEAWAQAVIYNRQVGDRAVARAANVEAVRAFQAALAALRHLPPSPELTEQAIDLRLDLRPPLLQLGRLDDVLALSREAEELAQQIGDEQRLARIYTYLVNYHYLKGETTPAIEYGERCARVGEACGDVALQGLARQYVGQSLHLLGEYDRAERVLRENLELLGPQHRGGTSYVASCAWLAFTLADLGRFDAAGACLDEAHRAAEAARHPWSQVIAWTMTGLVALRRGHLARAVLPLERSLEACRRKHLTLWHPIPSSLLGLTFARLGHVREGLQLLEHSVAQSRELGVRAYLAAWTINLGEGLLTDGQVDRAQAAAQEALDLARRCGERGHEAAALALLGRATARRTPDEAEAALGHLQAAAQRAEALGLHPLRAEILLDIAGVLTRAGDVPRATEHRVAADRLATELGLRRWQDRSETEVTELGHLFIVARSNPELYDFLAQELSGARRIRVVLDRRQDGRASAVDDDLQAWGLALAPRRQP
ncbi:MAG: hypothetical protein A3F92_01525 [Candidatus Rokubacteria bacterium RIFCSPLOWO2_12_FULL_71_22]|nr:MAG: hypothetical protein A3F92_01525 [Candidatus Rokubacteria bacterium RIFCSPLOWO2_12_FULL_71_22]